MKFEYLGNGNEAIFWPYKIEFKKEGQIISVSDEKMIEELKKRPDKFKPFEGKKTKKGGSN